MAGFSVKKPLTIFVTVLGIIVLGVVAYLKMTPDLLPNMDFPYVIIVTSDPGASPESIEQSITRPVEQAMATLDKIKTVTSTSQDSVSMVTLEFEDGANMDTISVDIQQKISVLQGSWDDTVSAPYVLKINPSMLPVMVAAVSREDMDVYALSDFVTGELSPKLEGVSGVASISVSGAVTREAHVILDEAKLDALSEKLADAVRTELNKTKLDLQKAKDKVEKGQAQLDEAKEAIAALKQAGVGKTVMLTGDAEPVAKAVSAQLGLDEYHAGLLPGDKVDQIETLIAAKKSKENLAFVGDGINDAPVLSRADVGIAMGALGSDAAIEAADVVLMDDDPAKIALAMRIARRTLRIVYENIVFALAIKFACLVLGALGLASMWTAIFADVGVMVLAVLNATRGLYTKDLARKNEQ